MDGFGDGGALSAADNGHGVWQDHGQCSLPGMILMLKDLQRLRDSG